MKPMHMRTAAIGRTLLPNVWDAAVLILVIGAMVRHYINRWDAGDRFDAFAWTLPVGAVALIGALYATVPREPPLAATGPVNDERVLTIAATHCMACHSQKPSNPVFNAAPKGVHLETLADLQRYKVEIRQQAVLGRAMPLGNTTHITDQERAELGAWIAAQQ